MTNEDAVKREAVLNTLDAMDAALDEDRTVEHYKELLAECFKALPAVTSQPIKCEDCVSRADAEGLFRNARKALMEQDRKEHIKDFNTRDLMLLNAEQMVHLLPSVTPERPRGEWIEYTRVLIPEPINKWEQAWYCSNCGYGNQESDESGWLEWKFCPNCGAKMEGESE